MSRLKLENLMGTGNRLNSNVLDGKDSMPTQTNDETPIPATKMQPLHAALKPNDTAPTLNTDKYLMSVSTTAFGLQFMNNSVSDFVIKRKLYVFIS